MKILHFCDNIESATSEVKSYLGDSCKSYCLNVAYPTLTVIIVEQFACKLYVSNVRMFATHEMCFLCSFDL